MDNIVVNLGEFQSYTLEELIKRAKRTFPGVNNDSILISPRTTSHWDREPYLEISRLASEK